jgi:hypothetical protein
MGGKQTVVTVALFVAGISVALMLVLSVVDLAHGSRPGSAPSSRAKSQTPKSVGVYST